MRWQLNVPAGGSFQLRMTYLDRSQAKRQDDIGRWHFDGSRRILRLAGGREAPLAFEVIDDNTLRKLDMKGQPIRSALNYELKRQTSFAPIEPELAFSGMYRYLADAGTITLCATGQHLPVAMEGDNAKLEAAYSAARKQPGDPLLVNLEGRIAQRMPMEGKTPRPTVVINRYINVWPARPATASTHPPAC
jgi:copper homeostasis protein (lipoprotein)